MNFCSHTSDKKSMKYSLILTLFLSNLAYSQEINFNIQKFIDGLNSVNKSEDQKKYCSEDDAKVSNKQNLNQCAIALCGEASKLSSGQFTNASAGEYITPSSLKDYEKYETKINTVIDRAIDKRLNLLKGFHTKIKEKNFQWSSFDLSDEEFNTLSESIYEEYIAGNIKSKGPLDERMTYKLRNTENLPKELIDGLKLYAEEKKRVYTNNYLYSLSYGMYTIDEARPILQARWDKFKVFYDKKIVESPDALEAGWKVQVDIIEKKILADEYLIGKDVMIDMYYISILEGMVQMPGRVDNIKTEALCTSDECRNGVLAYFKSDALRNSIETLKLRSIEDMDEQRELFRSHCKSEYLLNNRIDYDKQKMRDRLPRYIDKLTETMTSYFSDESSKQFGNYLKNDISFSLNLVEKDIDIDEEFTEQIDEVKLSIEGIETNYEDKDISTMLSDLMKTADAPDMCDLSSDGILWDAFIYQGVETEDFHRSDYNPEKNNVLVSQFSCTHEEYGGGILIHELGHALSYFLRNNKVSEKSYNWYLEKRKCITDNDKGQKKGSGYDEFVHAKDKFRSEEDMADYIYSLTGIGKNDEKIMGCSLLALSSDSENYLGLSLEADPEDTHSSSLMRVIMQALTMGREIPEPCGQLIETNKDKFGFKKCI